MGFVEVILNLRKVTGFIKQCKQDIEQNRPDKLILIDYPGFNLRIAKHAHQLGIPVYYYISPQIWAWKEGRVKEIKAHVDHMLVILPFEKEFYAKHNYPVEYVGHPLLDALSEIEADSSFFTRHQIKESPLIALLPGSRKQEIKVKLPLMLSVLDAFPEHQFIIAGAPGIDPSFYNQFIGSKRVQVVHSDTYQILLHAEAALVTSGTATLETALLEVPQVVCYKGNPISYFIAKMLIKVKYISLVNLILDKPAVKELIQDELNQTNLIKELKSILPGGLKRKPMMDQYKKLIQMLGNKGASTRAAEIITQNK